MDPCLGCDTGFMTLQLSKSFHTVSYYISFVKMFQNLAATHFVLASDNVEAAISCATIGRVRIWES